MKKDDAVPIIIFSLILICFIAVGGYFVHKGQKNQKIIKTFYSFSKKTESKIKNVEKISYKQYQHKLKHHQFMAYQKIFTPNKNNVYYSIFYGKNGQKYRVNLINNYNNAKNSPYFKKIKSYNTLSKPGFSSRKWYCANKKAIKDFLGQKEFSQAKITKQDIYNHTVCPKSLFKN